MRKIFSWMFAAILFCGAGLLSSCSDSDDNPVIPDKPVVVSADRQAFEAEFSDALAETVRQVRFDAIGQTLLTLNTFFSSIDGEQLNSQVSALFFQILGSMEVVPLNTLDEATLQQVLLCLDESFGLTPAEAAELGVFLTIDASKALGNCKFTFQDGKATQSISDGFTLEYIDAMGLKSAVTLQFKDKADGVRLFVTRLDKTVPVCVRLPKLIDISVTDATGLTVSGTIDLTTTAASNYMAFRNGQWLGHLVLTADFPDRDETVKATIAHAADGGYDIVTSLDFNGVEKFNLAVKGKTNIYPAAYFNSDELKSLHQCGPFYAAAFEVLKAVHGSTVESLEATLANRLVATATADDVASCLVALAKVQQLRGTMPGFAAVDAYTQQLNDHLHFTVGLKGSDVKGKGSLVTIQHDAEPQEYLPTMALQFAGEERPLTFFERMSEADMANYELMVQNIELLGKAVTMLVQTIQEKGRYIENPF